MKHAAPQFFTGASAPKKKVFVGPVQSRRIRRTLGEIGRVAARPWADFSRKGLGEFALRKNMDWGEINDLWLSNNE